MTALISLFSAMLTWLLPDPTAKDILLQSRAAVEQITSVKYEVIDYGKSMMQKDTSVNRFECVFQIDPKDTLVNGYFRADMHYGKGYENMAFYDGIQLADCNVKTKTATIFSTAQWPDMIANNTNHYHLFPPYTQAKHQPLPSLKTFEDEAYTFTLLKSDDPNFYRVRVFRQDTPDPQEMISVIDVAWEYDIRKTDFMPMAYTETIRGLMGQDTLIQYSRIQVTKLEINPVIEPGVFGMKNIPADYTISEYAPSREPEGLKPGDLAPDWSLTTLDGKLLSLQDLRGKVVLIDFFYKSCYPCLLAIPELQKLYERYKDQGLVVVGINVYDSNENNELGIFMQKRGVSYPVVVDGKPVAKEYKANGYPTLVCIDKQGKVIQSHTGYGPGIEVNYENSIKEGLAKP